MTDSTATPTASVTAAARLAAAANAVAALALLGLVAVQAWQVFARYVLNDSPSWTEPATLLLLATTMSLAAAAGVHARRHFAFSLLADAAGPRARRALAMLSDAIVLLVGALLARYGALLAIDQFDVRTAGAPWPQGAAFVPLALGGALMALFAAQHLIAAARTPAGSR